jgi:hypothetical protein
MYSGHDERTLGPELTKGSGTSNSSPRVGSEGEDSKRLSPPTNGGYA